VGVYSGGELEALAAHSSDAEREETKRLTVATAAVLLVATAALAGWLALASDASASAGVWHRRGAGADAVFTYMPDPCIEVDAWVSAANGAVQNPPGPPVARESMAVGIDVWDVCTGAWLDSFWGVTWAADVQITERAGLADGVVTVCNQWLDCFDLDVSVDWNVVGGVSVSRWRDRDRCNWRDHSASREATATGTLMLLPPDDPESPGNYIPEAVNLIPDPAVYASLYKWQTGAVCKA
jgi:hypothetical protein